VLKDRAMVVQDGTQRLPQIPCNIHFCSCYMYFTLTAG